MITLHQFGRGYGKPFSLSPFCTKLEAYLRLAGVDYESHPADPRKAPKGKAPYVRHSGGEIGDSSHIIAWCKATFGDPLDGDLGPEACTLGHLVQRTCEEHLYFALIYTRWVDDRGWALQKPEIQRHLPKPLRGLLPPIMRGSVRKQLHAQGLGRHSPSEIHAAGAADLEALSLTLGDKPFLLGDAPTSYDCAAYGQVVHCLTTPAPNGLTDAARGHRNLVDFCARMDQRIGW